MKIIGPEIVSQGEKERIIGAIRKEKDYSNRWNVPSWCMMWMSTGFAFFYTVATVTRYTALPRPWFDPMFWSWLWQATAWILLTCLFHVAWKAYKVRVILRETLHGNVSNPSSDCAR